MEIAPKKSLHVTNAPVPNSISILSLAFGRMSFESKIAV
jgi:hypothetical protein